jgi:hypothetical protein
MNTPTSDELLARIMQAVVENDAGWFDRLFAFLMAERLATEESFSPVLVAEIFEETGRRGKAKGYTKRNVSA